MTMGTVNFGGITKEVCLAYIPEVKVGDYVIVHVGFAISRIDEEEAADVFQALREMDEMGELDRPVGRRLTRVRPTAPAPDRLRRRDEVRRRVPRRRRTVQALSSAIAPHGHAALDAHGDLRRADPHAHQVGHRPHAART